MAEEKKLYAQGEMSDAEREKPGEDQRRARPLLGPAAPAPRPARIRPQPRRGRGAARPRSSRTTAANLERRPVRWNRAPFHLTAALSWNRIWWPWCMPARCGLRPGLASPRRGRAAEGLLEGAREGRFGNCSRPARRPAPARRWITDAVLKSAKSGHWETVGRA